MSTNQIKDEIAAYNRMQEDLMTHHCGKFVIIRDKKLEGAYDSFDAAAKEAIKRFGKGPYLIRQVGTPSTMPLPASVAYRPIHAC